MTRELMNWKTVFDRAPSIINDRVFDRLWQNFFDGFNTFEGATDGLFGSFPVPFDVRRVKEENRVIGTELIYTLAGYSPQDISVEVDETTNTLTIKANKVVEEDTEKYEYIRKGISNRNVNVSYHLSNVDASGITSTFDEGVLKVFIPFEAERPKLRTIPIETKKLTGKKEAKQIEKTS